MCCILFCARDDVQPERRNNQKGSRAGERVVSIKYAQNGYILHLADCNHLFLVFAVNDGHFDRSLRMQFLLSGDDAARCV